MLKHVVKAEILDLVFRGVDFLVRVLEVAFDDERRRIPSLGRAGMVGARVAALCKDVGNVAVLP